jgi:hypothetical protein
VYEKRDIAAEVGNSISCAKSEPRAGPSTSPHPYPLTDPLTFPCRCFPGPDGGQWLHEWNVDIPSGLPIDLQNLIMRDYKTGAVDMDYDMSGYEAKWGFPYYMLSVLDGEWSPVLSFSITDTDP